MKKVLFTIVIAIVCVTLQAQTRLIAVKGETTNTVVETLDEAITTAQAGDKIYLPGGAFSVSDTIQKKIYIIGSGYNDRIPRVTLPTIIMGDLYVGTNAQETIIEGLAFDNTGSFHIMADDVLLRRCEIFKTVKFKACENGQIIHCITNWIEGEHINIYNSLVKGSYAKNSSIFNSIIKYCYTTYSMFQNSIYGNLNSSHNSYINCYRNYNGICNGNATELAKIFRNSPTNNFFNLENNYQLTDSLVNIYPNLGIYKMMYPWKDGGQPINPHIEENNSYLDAQAQQFKLRVKVKAQSN